MPSINQGSTTDNGKQQVSIYPYQQLSSVYGNEILYGFLSPGAYSSKISITSDSTNVIFQILAGSTFVFQRQAVDPIDNTITDRSFIAKIVLTSTATISIPKSTIWTNASKAVFVVADWVYDLLSPTTIYVNFGLELDSTVVANVKNYDGTFNHKIIVATVLNNQLYITDWAGPKTYQNNMTKYHISYDYQPNRDVLKKEFLKSNNYRIDFNPQGRGVYVNAGHSYVNGNFIFRNPAFFNLYIYTDGALPFNLLNGGSGNAYGEGNYFTDREVNDSAMVLLPAVGITTYYGNLSTGVGTDVTGSESNYYQIDFLRIKRDELTHAITLGWESFLQPIASPPLDFTNYSQTVASGSMIQSNILSYLSLYTFSLSGGGDTLMVAVRERSSIPLTDGGTNILWPESCIFPNDQGFLQVGSAPNLKREKIPVWNSTDIGAY